MLWVLGSMLVAACGQPEATSTPTATPTPTYSPAPTSILTSTPTHSPAPTSIPTSTPATPTTPPNCPTDLSEPLFEVSPIQLSDLLAIVPLGSLNPPGHTLPTDHLYFYVRMTGAEPSTPASVTVFAPGRIWMTRITEKYYASGSLPDYTLTIKPCNQFAAYFHHVEELSESLLVHAGSFEDDDCTTYRCSKDVMIEMQAGEIIEVSEGGLDFGAMDSRGPPLAYANPARYWSASSGLDPHHLVCAIDYYSPNVRDQLLGWMGDHSGQTPRTVEPICGEVEQDEPGTAQGNWFLRGTVGTPPFPNTTHLALVHDNVDPLLGTFSVGAPVPGLGPFAENFAPQTSGGRVNLDFSQVIADGNIYCYDSWHNRLGDPISHPQPRIILIQLTSETTLRIEKQDTTESECGTGPWAFQSNFVDFER